MPIFLLLGAINAFLAVACGAFGAHGLKAMVTPDMLAVWKTGAEYQMYHAIGLVLIASLYDRLPATARLMAIRAGWLFAVGILFFSGSLYALALTGTKILGAITPLGGLCFLVGWAFLAVGAYQARVPENRMIQENR